MSTVLIYSEQFNSAWWLEFMGCLGRMFGNMRYRNAESKTVLYQSKSRPFRRSLFWKQNRIYICNTGSCASKTFNVHWLIIINCSVISFTFSNWNEILFITFTCLKQKHKFYIFLRIRALIRNELNTPVNIASSYIMPPPSPG
jgi:hypothetical protein